MYDKQFRNQLAQLVALPSVSSADPAHDQSNLEVVTLLASWLEDLGFDCALEAVPDWPGKYNLVAVRGSGDRGLVLAGHSDTVPCNPELWQQDPFVLTEKNQRFYGLGATDMKGFFPVVLAALQQLKDAPLRQPIYVLATADEESSMCGARALVDQQRPLARFAIIGEPTNLTPIRMHKGILMESVRILGRAGHSSNPALGNNALEVMHKVMAELLSYRAHLQQQYHHPGFAVALPTLNLGCIHGGDNPNRICGSCELHFDLRPLPGMSVTQLREDFQQRLRPIAEQSGTDIVFRSLFPGIEPYEEPAGSAIVKLTEKLTGRAAESAAFATEAPFFKTLGMETLVMGPGSIDRAHQPDEYIEAAQIPEAIDLIKQVITATCIEPSGRRDNIT